MTERRPRRFGRDCLTHCVAYIFQLNPERVPLFIAFEDWVRRLRRFFNRRGYDIHNRPYAAAMGLMRRNPKHLFIIQGVSPRQRKQRREHAVIYRGTQPIFDPHQSQRFIRGEPTFVWVITKLRREDR